MQLFNYNQLFLFHGNLCYQQNFEKGNWPFFQTDTRGPVDKCGPHKKSGFYCKLKHLENMEKVLPCVSAHNPDLRKGKKFRISVIPVLREVCKTKYVLTEQHYSQSVKTSLLLFLFISSLNEIDLHSVQCELTKQPINVFLLSI